MDIRIKTTDFQMTPDLSDLLYEKLVSVEKTLGAEAEQTRCEVEVGRAAGHHRHSEHMYFAEIQLVRPGAARLVARNHEPTVNASIDNAKDELLHQLRREKKLHSRVWRKSGAFAKRLLRLE